jgi:uroporphyrinogen decarboxylase
VIIKKFRETMTHKERVVKDTLEIMMDGYGYHFAPAHAIQDNTTVENVIAMYQSVYDYGFYR